MRGLAFRVQADTGRSEPVKNRVPVPERCREHVSAVRPYKWRSKLGGMDSSMMTRLKAETLKKAVEKSGKAVSPP